jgi:hypothetical protein
MRILPAIEYEIRRASRDARALDPIINVVALQVMLEKKFKRTFRHEYVSKLLHKVAREGLIEADRTQIEERLAQTRENYRLIRERLLKIVYWTPESAAKGIKPPFHAEIIDAAKTIVMLDLALLKAEIDNGLYKKPVEALAKEIRYEPLPGEIRAVVIAAWQRGGLLPESTIKEMVPIREP